MVFKRRDRRPILRIVKEFFYPRGGWVRAARYIKHRLRRLPDEPERIARGIFCGVFVSFTPFFGLHFLSAALMALIVRGNVLASLLATFIGNPLTTPIIAYTSVKLGHYMLGDPTVLNFDAILTAFSSASRELWANARAIFTDAEMQWSNLALFHEEIFFPYFIGGLLPGFIISLIIYFVSLPLIRAYQGHRLKTLKKRINKAQMKKEAEMIGQQTEKHGGGDESSS